MTSNANGFLFHKSYTLYTVLMANSRNRFQLHLSTAMVLMVLAGGLVWLNLRSRPLFSPKEIRKARWVRDTGEEVSPKEAERLLHFQMRGWPWHFHMQHRDAEMPFSLGELSKNDEKLIHLGKSGLALDRLFLNGLVSVAILLAAALTCEARIRNRERTQQETQV